MFPLTQTFRFCDGDDKDISRRAKANKKSKLACLEELVSGIESSKGTADPWKEFPALRLILKDRVDFDSGGFPIIQVEREYCKHDERPGTCDNETAIDFGPKEIMNGKIFGQFSKIWQEKGDPLGEKLEQLRSVSCCCSTLKRIGMCFFQLTSSRPLDSLGGIRRSIICWKPHQIDPTLSM